MLVRPEPQWLATGNWDPNAEAAHGLARDVLLRDGLPAAEVRNLLARAFGGRVVLADTGSGSIDDMWLAVLYEVAGRDPARWRVKERTTDDVIIDVCRRHGLCPELVLSPLCLIAPRPTHAAAEEALAEAWVYAMVEQLGRFKVGERDVAGQRSAMQNLAGAVSPDCWPRVGMGDRGCKRCGA